MEEFHLLGLFTWESVRLHHHAFFSQPSLPKFGCSATEVTIQSPSSKLFISLFFFFLSRYSDFRHSWLPDPSIKYQ